MTENDYLEGFERFWSIYPRKASKGSAKKTWLKLVKGYEKEDFDAFITKLVMAVDSQIRRKKRDGDETLTYWKHPTTWLNGECWLDSVEDITENRPVQLRNCYCGREVHGPKFDVCTFHLSVDKNGKYTHPPADLLRDYYRKHPEIHHFKREQAIAFIKSRMREIGK